MSPPKAQRRGLNPNMLIEFVDGSKTMIEMATVSIIVLLPSTGLDQHDKFRRRGPRWPTSRRWAWRAGRADLFALALAGG